VGRKLGLIDVGNDEFNARKELDSSEIFIDQYV